MKNYLSLVKFSHTIFALPFAMLGFFLAVHGPASGFDPKLLVMVLLCMVFARSAAMGFNRYLDREIDKNNPRTSNREIPAGIISPRAAVLFVWINAALFIVTTWFINPLCFMLSPVALLVILGYSYTKRFTWLCHFVLGLGLSLAPIGAYLAGGGGFDLIPLLYAAVVLFWVAGFDIMYALQDESFDQQHRLFSVPAAFGIQKALRISEGCHVLSAGFLLFATWQLSQTYPVVSWLTWVGAFFFIGLLLYQHRIVQPPDLSRINLAFFTTNGIASLLFASLVIFDFYW